MRGTILIAFLIFGTQGAMFAQTTWHDLRFGTPEDEVRKTYGEALSKAIRSRGTASENTVLTGAFNLFPYLHVKVEFFMGGGNKLEQISISADDPFAGSDNDAASSATISNLTDMLLQKYGHPLKDEGKFVASSTDNSALANEEKRRRGISGKGKCISLSNDSDAAILLVTNYLLSCDQMWKSEGQNITLHWFIEHDRLIDLNLTYKPVPSGV